MSSGYLNLFARDLKVLYYHSAAVLQPGKAETWCVTLGMKVVWSSTEREERANARTTGSETDKSTVLLDRSDVEAEVSSLADRLVAARKTEDM